MINAIFLMGLVGSNSWGSSDDMNHKYICELSDYGTSQSEFIFNWGLLSGLERKEHDKKLEESYNKFKADPKSVCIYRDPKKQEEFEAKKLDEERRAKDEEISAKLESLSVLQAQVDDLQKQSQEKVASLERECMKLSIRVDKQAADNQYLSTQVMALEAFTHNTDLSNKEREVQSSINKYKTLEDLKSALNDLVLDTSDISAAQASLDAANKAATDAQAAYDTALYANVGMKNEIDRLDTDGEWRRKREAANTQTILNIAEAKEKEINEAKAAAAKEAAEAAKVAEEAAKAAAAPATAAAAPATAAAEPTDAPAATAAAEPTDAAAADGTEDGKAAPSV